MSILEVNNVSKSFGGVKANVDISMNVEKGKIVGLIGPNGSGKTTLGKIVSKKLNKEFIDVDQAIEQQEGMVISEIFKKKGEPFFRVLEEKISLLSLKKNNTVISLGGGAFLNKKIQKLINK